MRATALVLQNINTKEWDFLMPNTVILSGHLGADPTINQFDNGTSKASFTLYLNERYKRKDSEEATETTHRFQVEAWGTTANFVSDYLRKGLKVLIQGSLRENTWVAEGENRSRVVIRATSIEILTPKDSGSQSTVPEMPGQIDETEF
jgi:single-strand DNA-binding protein